MIGLIVLAIFAFLVAIYTFGLYNSLVMVKNNIDKAWANIDVLLKQRHDEIPKLIKTCEAYMQFERGTLEKVIALRQQAVSATSLESRAKAEGELSFGLTKLFALSENYPDLKSQNNFQQLQSRISGLESQIADRREFYNDSVNILNNYQQ
jgi:LemA protein